jgi:SAM-dependent methyltransferase
VSPVPRAAAIGFDRGAADYERGRPGYPPAAISLLAKELGIGPGRRVVDLAAGTGKLTRALVDLGADVVAVEPVAGMREQLRRAVPGVEPVDGTAERLPLPDAGVDAVVVAQAFHWFDVPAAAAEIQRVLAPGGGLGIIRNEWDKSVAWVAAMYDLIREHAGDPPHRHPPGWRAALDATGRFAPLTEQVLPNPVEVDVETLAARVASLSYIAMLPAAERERLLDAVRRLVAERGVAGTDGLIQTPYRTHVLYARALPPAP